MANFVVGTQVETKEPMVEFTVSAEKPLAAGRHRVQLIVEDDSGNKSAPDIAIIIVKDSQNPTAVIEAPPQVEFGRSFPIAGSKSSDVAPGKVVKYLWTLLE